MLPRAPPGRTAVNVLMNEYPAPLVAEAALSLACRGWLRRRCFVLLLVLCAQLPIYFYKLRIDSQQLVAQDD